MCGIVGIITSQPGDLSDLAPALRVMQHRGPDDQGSWQNGQVALGHTRLAIIDITSSGHQPMNYQDQRFWITFNGEIYNYLELRQELVALGYPFRSHSDTEVLIAAYVHWGVSCLSKLRGMFAFAIWDRRERKLFLARDRIGEKPLYYTHTARGFFFASELKALLSLLPDQPKIDPTAIDLYLHYQFVPEPDTPLKDVRKLPAAHYLLLDEHLQQIIPIPYWGLEQIKPIDGDPIALIRAELDRTIDLTLRSDVPVGIALSGGLDSGAIATLATLKYQDTLQAFSIGYPGRPAYDERQQAAELAKLLGLPFFELELRTAHMVDFFPQLVNILDDPIADLAAYGHYAVAHLAAQHGVKVLLTGIGGDELFWGYSWIRNALQLTERKKHNLNHPLASAWKYLPLETLTHHALYQGVAHSGKVPLFVRRALQTLFDVGKVLSQTPRVIFYDAHFEFRSTMNYTKTLYTKEVAAQIPENNAYRPFMCHLKDLDNLPRHLCQLLFATWYVSNCLALGDRVSMASSVETRLPLADYKLIELVMGLRQTHPDYQLGHKYWLKAALAGRVPEQILQRPKRGFEPPMHEWVEAILNQYLSHLKDGYLINSGIFCVDNVRSLWRAFESNRKHMSILFKLLLLELWCQTVVVKHLRCPPNQQTQSPRQQEY